MIINEIYICIAMLHKKKIFFLYITQVHTEIDINKPL